MSIVAINLMAVGRPADGLDLAEEALSLAEHVGAPSVIAIAANALSGALVDTDSERAAALADQFLTNALSIGADLGVSLALGALGRSGQHAEDPLWATRYREVLDRTFEAGDLRLVLVQLDMYGQVLARIGRCEASAVLYGTIRLDSQHLDNPVSMSRRDAQLARIASALGDDRARELVAEGERLQIADAIRIAREELDRVIQGSGAEA